jgi:hypothetical protein
MDVQLNARIAVVTEAVTWEVFESVLLYIHNITRKKYIKIC